MANQSATFVTIIISTKNKEDLKEFMYLQLLSEKIPGVFSYNKINIERVLDNLNALVTKGKEKYQVELRIDIADREAFKDNVGLFFEKILTKEYENKSVNNLRDRLKGVKLEATFDIRDYDAYSQCIDKIVYKIESFNGNNTLTIIKE